MLFRSKGVISVTANVAPRHMANLAQAAIDGNTELATSLQADLLPLHEALFVEANPIPVKWVLSQMGLIEDELRLPLTSLDERHQASLKIILQKLSLI